MINRTRAVVFDCDGVLLDSRQANLAYYNRILDYFSEPVVTADQTERAYLCHTGSTPQVLAGLLGQARVDEALAVAEAVNYQDFIEQLTPEPGLEGVLQRLAEHFPLAIATNRRGTMHQILDHFKWRDFFQVVVTSCDVERPKPHPDVLFAVASRLDCRGKDMVYVGDSTLDRQAAERASVPFIAYKWDGGRRIDHHQQLLPLLL
ncbi:MAG: HAD-IA family hydrolase [Desulfuromonadaceae bacterium]|nr:HAD-IA family hydrolase [Desulfuromonadaceae bacterium]